MLGQVKMYNPKKFYGFIHGDDGKDYFVPYCNIDLPSRSLSAGCTVEFNTGKNERGSDVALNVRYV